MSIFGTDGVRGPANMPPLAGSGPAEISAAALTYLAEPGDTVLVGYDPRESSLDIVDNLAKGAARVGVTTEIIGVIPTPGLAYATRETDDIAAGIMVSASHNGYQDNGIKIFSGQGTKLPDSAQSAIEELYNSGVSARGERGARVVVNSGHLTRYGRFLVASAGPADFGGLRIGIDPANGAASGIAERVFGELGARVFPINNQPDGRNINVASGATYTAALREHVTENGLDLGVAFDGDADRLIMVDERGREFNGDRIMHLLGSTGAHEGVVATVMTNLGTERALAAGGIKLHRTQVGDRYVLEGMAEVGWRLGGEQSGHIIQSDLLATGDGMLAAIQAIRAMRESGRSLAEWHDAVHMVPQKLINISVPDKNFADHPAAREAEARLRGRLGDTGRVLLRKSGTEDVVRVMVESPDAAADAEALAQEIHDLAWVR